MQSLKQASKLFVAVSILMLRTAFAYPSQADISGSEHEAEVKTGVIFSPEISAVNGLCAQPRLCWQPTSVDIVDLEESFTHYLSALRIAGASKVSENLPGYKRKYFGYTKKGERWILVIGLCAKYWRRDGSTFQMVKRPMTDMGVCYFSAEYNVKTKRFFDFYLDGEA